MAEFETLILCVSLNLGQMCIIFPGLSFRVLSVPGQKFDSQPSSIFKLILLHTPYCYGLDVREVSFYTGRGALEIFQVLQIFSDPPNV